MSRKPVAVSVDTDPETPPSKKTKVKSTPQEKVEAKRKPVAVEAPETINSEDVFDPDSPAYIEDLPNHLPATGKSSKLRWLFFASVSTLITLGIGLWFTQVVEALFERHVWLGWGASILLGIAALCLLVVLLNEVYALWQLRKLTRLREDVMRVMEGDDNLAPKTLDKVVNLYTERADMRWHIAQLAGHKEDVMDPRDRLLLAERTLMKPLDHEAQQLISKSARRVAVVTAINPAASLDVLFTGYQILRMLRQLTALYGNRPGSIGTFKLAGMVGSHLAITGGLALSDTLMQQFIGKGLAGKLSAKLGEGTINGILTARIGLAALDLCRPMPFKELQKPGLQGFITSLLGSSSSTQSPDEK